MESPPARTASKERPPGLASILAIVTLGAASAAAAALTGGVTGPFAVW